MRALDDDSKRMSQVQTAPDQFPDKTIVPDGGRVRVGLTAMDSVQRSLASSHQSGCLDAQTEANLAYGRSVLAKMRKDADRAQAFADHYTALRKSSELSGALGDACRATKDAWKNHESVGA